MLQATEDDVRTQLAAIADRQKIADLVLDYCRGVDRLDDRLLRSTYWPEPSTTTAQPTATPWTSATG